MPLEEGIGVRARHDAAPQGDVSDRADLGELERPVVTSALLVFEDLGLQREASAFAEARHLHEAEFQDEAEAEDGVGGAVAHVSSSTRVTISGRRFTVSTMNSAGLVTAMPISARSWPASRTSGPLRPSSTFT